MSPNYKAQVRARPLCTIPCHQQKALPSCVPTKAQPTTCWWALPLEWNPRRKQMPQGEAICPLGTQRSPCHRRACGWSQPPRHQGSRGIYQQLTPSLPPLGKECWAVLGGGGSAPDTRRRVPGSWSVTHKRLPGKQQWARRARGPGEGADGQAGASHTVAAPKPRVRPSPPGLGSLRDVRRERARRSERHPPRPAGTGPGKADTH